MMRTSIEWATDTLNPGLFGCTKVSEACDHCYAMPMSHRLAAMGVEGYGSLNELLHPPITVKRSNGVQWTGHVRRVSVDEMARRVAGFRRPKVGTERPRVFVTSMSDVLHESIPIEWTAALVRAMSLRSDCDWLLLTKRAHRLPELASVVSDDRFTSGLASPVGTSQPWVPWPPNVWVGVTAENQRRANERIPFLLRVPAVRYVSIEPMGSAVDLTMISDNSGSFDALAGDGRGQSLHWVIAGGESGQHARPSHPEWFRSLRDQCAAAGVPFLFKQWGEWLPISDASEQLVDSLYRSNRKAGAFEDQSELDEAYGRTLTVKQIVLRTDGNHLPIGHADSFRSDRPGWPAMHAFCVGKKRAGRVLDGVTHDGFPGRAA